ncbi:MAG: thioredoxin domain-containing protein [Kiloniellaceae bacterium]|nr:thioredoxin domain-containing protein [Kiloniellaceae bacterium]
MKFTAGARKLGWLLLPIVLVMAGAVWFALDPGFRGSEDPPEATLPNDELDRRIRAYILENPEVIVEAMQRLQARQRTAAASEAEAVLRARADEVFRDATSPVGGNPDGDVTLVEFFDYNCPYCRSVAPVMNEVEAADPQLRIVYKEFPILGPNSVYAAKAALAAHRQGRYLALHQALMQAEGAADSDRVLAVAAEVGLDVERLKTDMEDSAIQEAIDRNLALAEALRITGTPGFVVGRRVLRGATDLATLQRLIAEARVTE